MLIRTGITVYESRIKETYISRSYCPLMRDKNGHVPEQYDQKAVRKGGVL
jgi:hypothetical protein